MSLIHYRLENFSGLIKTVDLGVYNLNTLDSSYTDVLIPKISDYKYISFSISPGQSLKNVSSYYHAAASILAIKGDATGDVRLFAYYIKDI
jgi:hypothetical protein